MIARTEIERDTVEALCELVKTGDHTWRSAVLEFRSEFSCSLLYCADIGFTARVQALDAEWAKHVAGSKVAAAQRGRIKLDPEFAGLGVVIAILIAMLMHSCSTDNRIADEGERLRDQQIRQEWLDNCAPKVLPDGSEGIVCPPKQ